MPHPDSFALSVPDGDIADLHDRLARTRWPDAAPLAPWSVGTDLGYMRDLVEYWRHDFDWRAQEAALNAFPQYRVELDGIPLHFLRVLGRGTPGGPPPMPLLLMHGWPGSVFEFLEIIPRLTDPARFGGDPADAFTWAHPADDRAGFARLGVEHRIDDLRRGRAFRKVWPPVDEQPVKQYAQRIHVVRNGSRPPAQYLWA